MRNVLNDQTDPEMECKGMGEHETNRNIPKERVLLRDAFKLFRNSSVLSSCTRPLISVCKTIKQTF